MNRYPTDPIDRLIVEFDQGLRTLFGQPKITERPDPAAATPDCDLEESQRDHVGRLMRINHTGEVCAQALYQGQALTARTPEVRDALARSAEEENDHLDWCERRIDQLGGRKSLLNPFWYVGSLTIGALAGVAGDRWSLGFVHETERQVEGHLDEHLAQLPPEDEKSRKVLEQMRDDEIEHGSKAMALGGTELPDLIKKTMKLTAKMMTTAVYRI